jgi:hypothetical protein
MESWFVFATETFAYRHFSDCLGIQTRIRRIERRFKPGGPTIPRAAQVTSVKVV